MMSSELIPYDGDSPKPPAKQRRGYARKSASLRRAMMAAVTQKDVYEIVKLQVFLARRGDPLATREVLDRVVGKPASMESIMLLEARESGTSDLAMVDEAVYEAIAMMESVPTKPADPLKYVKGLLAGVPDASAVSPGGCKPERRESDDAA